MPKRNKALTGVKSIEWAAGLFEGEGYLSRTRDRWDMAIKMTDRDVLQDFLDIVKYGKLNGPYHSASMKEHHRPYYRWRTYNNQEIFRIIAEFYPLMGERRLEKFNEFLSFFTTTTN